MVDTERLKAYRAHLVRRKDSAAEIGQSYSQPEERRQAWILERNIYLRELEDFDRMFPEVTRRREPAPSAEN